jgi:alpha-amylase
MLAYAVILTHEGYACVFWQDYYNWGLGQAGSRSGIEALVRIHEDHAGGATSVLYCDDNLYIMQRKDVNAQRGLIFVMNNRGEGWNGAWVRTRWQNTGFASAAWQGKNDAGVPRERGPKGMGGENFTPRRGGMRFMCRRNEGGSYLGIRKKEER